ncbi:MAG TPA: N-acetyl-gamma-glutamyl-phosphate reductase [Candidatus Thermoplasmatota archaeon]|jgi:N-acetyl-gamma-glutamyl-phosphate/LysW-gamma-L-alpha-aminoadipyl-6-phosphate reductase|nr:N-acetyl-gamma-glutamyl-phosphate reductase [Candidatus Thermoplasmatota archaeon]
MLDVGIVGASGYGGGELLRLLSGHPGGRVAYATSDRFAGKPARSVHPNLRALDLEFQPHRAADEREVDALFFAGPHGTSAPRMRQYLKLAKRVLDLSADFRLADPALYPTFYEGWQHPAPELLRDRAYGIAELHRDAIRRAPLVAGAGCIATASILGLAPLAKRGLIEDRVVVDAKVGSSAAGAAHGPGSHHPERRDVLRTYAATGHRHTAEILQETGLQQVGLTCTAVELVRGILATCHVWLREDLDEKAVWKVYREAYGNEPFVRVVKERSGLYRYPEPKLVAGTNFCHIGFERDPMSNRLVVLSAIDNLVKGTAGAAVQNFNLAFGLDETTALQQVGLHP